MLKIEPNDYTKLEQIIETTIKTTTWVSAPKSHELNKTQYLWHVWHVARMRASQKADQDDYSFMRGLSDYLSDDEIESTLRWIIKSYPSEVKDDASKGGKAARRKK